MTRRCSRFATLLLAATACSPSDDGLGDDTEVISRLELTFTPQAGGTAVAAVFDDPDGDGGVSGTAEAVTLSNGVTFDLDIAFVNGLVEPPRDITAEVEAEAEEHLVLVLGDAVRGPVSASTDALVEHAYADRESDYAENTVGDDLPVGVRNTVSTVRAGTGSLRVMLRHMPPIGDEIQKSADVTELAAMDRPLPGEVDADVTFELTVQ